MNRDDIIERMQPLIGQLADGLVALVSDLARERVLAALEGMTEPSAPTLKRKAKRNAVKQPAVKAARQNHCRNCGAAGFQTKTCGITHNLEGFDPKAMKPVATPAPTAPRGRHVAGPVDEHDAPAPDSKRDRFAKLEEAARRRRGGA